MSDYEPAPTSKIAALIAGMRATAVVQPVWTQYEAAKVMGVARSAVPPYLVSALSHRLLFRRTVQDGLELSLKPFEAAPAGSNYEPYVPTKTEVPRPGSDTPVVSGKPPKLCTGCSRTECWDNGCQSAAADAQVVAAAVPAPTPAPTPSPAPAPTEAELTVRRADGRRPCAYCIGTGKNVMHGHPCEKCKGTGLHSERTRPATTEPEPAPARNRFHKRCDGCRNPECLKAGCLSRPEPPTAPELEEPALEQAEEVEQPDAFLSCRTGAIIVTGVEQEEDGSFILPPDLVTLIKRQIAWSPTR